jgi:predicted ribosome quality control (RQC) complex YloA/Tae2 family protein
MGKYLGFSPLIAREIAFRAAKSVSAMTGECKPDVTWFYFRHITEKIISGNFSPHLLSKNMNEPADFSFIEIRQYGNALVRIPHESMSAMLDHYFSVRESGAKIRQKSQDILKLLGNIHSRLTKKIRLQKTDLEECAGKEKFRTYGDYICSNIYALKKGMPGFTADDYYTEGKTITIPLDVNLTPQQNSQRYYKRYSKLKTAELHLNKQIGLAELELEYLETVLDALTRALTEPELAEIRDELAANGYVSAKKSGKNLRKAAISKPLEFTSPTGLRILCGKNNTQNDYITFKQASKTDLWFHIRNMPGSHVILLCGSAEASDADIEEAAKIAAVHSKGKNMPLAPVDYTAVRYVSKPAGSKPGFVIYRNFKTVNVRTE